MKISLKAAAKINLLLDLTAVLENGYHSIYTVMQSVSLYDTVTLELNDSGKISLTCSELHIPTDSTNTAYKAAESFFDYIGKEHGVNIYIDKVIPSKAGLAGGSADAAAVIKGLDMLLDTKLPTEALYKICEKVGSDVPFCLTGGTKLCLNKGEIMADLPNFPDCHIVIVKPAQGISTKKAYELYNNAEWIRHPDNEGFLYASTIGDFNAMCAKAANVFEQVVEVYDRVKIKAVMRNYKAKLSLMTGSGSAVFGIFEREIDAKMCADKLKKEFRSVFLCTNEKSAITEI